MQLLAHQLGVLPHHRDAVRHIFQRVAEVVAVHVLGDLPQLFQLFSGGSCRRADLIDSLVIAVAQVDQHACGCGTDSGNACADHRKGFADGGSALLDRVGQGVLEVGSALGHPFELFPDALRFFACVFHALASVPSIVADIRQSVRHIRQAAGHFAVTGVSGSLSHVIQGVFCLLRAFFYGGHGVISLFFDPL